MCHCHAYLLSWKPLDEAFAQSSIGRRGFPFSNRLAWYLQILVLFCKYFGKFGICLFTLWWFTFCQVPHLYVAQAAFCLWLLSHQSKTSSPQVWRTWAGGGGSGAKSMGKCRAKYSQENKTKTPKEIQQSAAVCALYHWVTKRGTTKASNIWPQLLSVRLEDPRSR